MKINFIPQRRDDALAVSKAGDVLIINGESFDFSGLPDGATIPEGEVPCDWIVGPVERIDGDLRLTLILPYRIGNRHVDVPPPLVDPGNGPLTLPVMDPEETDDVDA